MPSIALGTSEVSLLELTGAYLPFATGGIRRPLFGVIKVEDDRRRGALPPRADGGPGGRSPSRGRGHARADGGGRGRRAPAAPRGLPDRVAAGKTGTTQDGRDAWFVGYAGDYVAGVWLGNDDNRPMKGVLGSNLPAQIWREAMLATPKPRAARRRRRSRSRSEENGLEWLIDLVRGGRRGDELAAGAQAQAADARSSRVALDRSPTLQFGSLLACARGTRPAGRSSRRRFARDAVR